MAVHWAHPCNTTQSNLDIPPLTNLQWGPPPLRALEEDKHTPGDKGKGLRGFGPASVKTTPKKYTHKHTHIHARGPHPTYPTLPIKIDKGRQRERQRSSRVCVCV